MSTSTKKSARIATLTTQQLIDEIDAVHPGTREQVEARMAELAVARRLRSLREKHGWTQAELAERAGTAQASIARIESGKSTPKLDLLSRIAAALGTRLEVRFRPT